MEFEMPPDLFPPSRSPYSPLPPQLDGDFHCRGEKVAALRCVFLRTVLSGLIYHPEHCIPAS